MVVDLRAVYLFRAIGLRILEMFSNYRVTGTNWSEIRKKGRRKGKEKERKETINKKTEDRIKKEEREKKENKNCMFATSHVFAFTLLRGI